MAIFRYDPRWSTMKGLRATPTHALKRRALKITADITCAATFYPQQVRENCARGKRFRARVNSRPRTPQICCTLTSARYRSRTRANAQPPRETFPRAPAISPSPPCARRRPSGHRSAALRVAAVLGERTSYVPDVAYRGVNRRFTLFLIRGLIIAE